ncbi:hypothetical protein NQ176_g6960 [Zarea fungicola]|uniref:Uncharacterized protein n=1 Tax=Zarea fungicola TaxID=93591 RepID=A0ACC1N1Q3_9HYPO|nr:hypothetical protein NQ176_g6960 [Lecanicillium fungicola]
MTSDLSTGLLYPPQAEEKRISWKDLDNTVLAYMKSRGQHQAVNLNGCILTERANENERFYNSQVTQMDILAGNISRHVEETKPLFEVIKMAEGRTDFDAAVIERTAVQPAPGDAVIETPRSATPASPQFGLPKSDDPDPFGILALEMAGLEIREAGSRLRPASSQIDFAVGPKSPAMSKFSRQSIESMARSNRGSHMSNRTIRSQLSDVATQTDVGSASRSPRHSDERAERPSMDKDDASQVVDYTAVDMSSLRHISQEYAKTPAIAEEPEEATIIKHGDESKAEKPANVLSKEDQGVAEDEDNEDDDEEPVIYEVAAVQPARTQAVASRMIQARGNVVTIAKRIPPPLPRRSPARTSRLMKNEGGGDVHSLKSPLRQAFSEADLRDDAVSTDGADDIRSTGDIDESRLSRISDIGQVLRSNRASVVSSRSATKLEISGIETISLENAPVNFCDESETDFVDAISAAPLHVEKRAVNLGSDTDQEAYATPPVVAPEIEAESTKPAALTIMITKEENKATPTTDVGYPTVDMVEDSDAAMDGDDEDISDISDSELLDAEFSIMEPTSVTTMRLSQISSSSDTKLQKLEFRKSHEISGEKREVVMRKSFVDDGLNSAMSAFDEMARLVDSDSHSSTPHHEHTDASDSASFKKHTSSVYTGATDDRWSYDGSSPTTPTSDRPSSMAGDVTDEGTPKKCRRKTQQLEPVDGLEPLEPATSHNGDTTPTTVTVA